MMLGSQRDYPVFFQSSQGGPSSPSNSNFSNHNHLMSFSQKYDNALVPSAIAPKTGGMRSFSQLHSSFSQSQHQTGQFVPGTKSNGFPLRPSSTPAVINVSQPPAMVRPSSASSYLDGFAARATAGLRQQSQQQTQPALAKDTSFGALISKSLSQGLDERKAAAAARPPSPLPVLSSQWQSQLQQNQVETHDRLDAIKEGVQALAAPISNFESKFSDNSSKLEVLVSFCTDLSGKVDQLLGLVNQQQSQLAVLQEAPRQTLVLAEKSTQAQVSGALMATVSTQVEFSALRAPAANRRHAPCSDDQQQRHNFHQRKHFAYPEGDNHNGYSPETQVVGRRSWTLKRTVIEEVEDAEAALGDDGHVACLSVKKRRVEQVQQCCMEQVVVSPESQHHQQYQQHHNHAHAPKHQNQQQQEQPMYTYKVQQATQQQQQWQGKVSKGHPIKSLMQQKQQQPGSQTNAQPPACSDEKALGHSGRQRKPQQQHAPHHVSSQQKHEASAGCDIPEPHEIPDHDTRGIPSRRRGCADQQAVAKPVPGLPAAADQQPGKPMTRSRKLCGSSAATAVPQQSFHIAVDAVPNNQEITASLPAGWGNKRTRGGRLGNDVPTAADQLASSIPPQPVLLQGSEAHAMQHTGLQTFPANDGRASLRPNASAAGFGSQAVGGSSQAQKQPGLPPAPRSRSLPPVPVSSMKQQQRQQPSLNPATQQQDAVNAVKQQQASATPWITKQSSSAAKPVASIGQRSGLQRHHHASKSAVAVAAVASVNEASQKSGFGQQGTQKMPQLRCDGVVTVGKEYDLPMTDWMEAQRCLSQSTPRSVAAAAAGVRPPPMPPAGATKTFSARGTRKAHAPAVDKHSAGSGMLSLFDYGNGGSILQLPSSYPPAPAKQQQQLKDSSSSDAKGVTISKASRMKAMSSKPLSAKQNTAAAVADAHVYIERGANSDNSGDADPLMVVDDDEIMRQVAARMQRHRSKRTKAKINGQNGIGA